METDIVHEREVAHSLLDALPHNKLSAVRSLLEVMVEPTTGTFADAPYEDEELNKETSVELATARASLAASRGIPHKEILSEFGL